MLRAPCHAALPSCSQGARGLSVLWRVTGVFTGTTTSPGWLSRQRSDRYAIRAGRNLPDKEFRYLRTVIVTAAVHRGFDSRPCRSEPLLLTFRHRAGVSPYTSCSTLQRPVFLLNSRLSRFPAAPPRGGAPLLPKLRGQFAEFLDNQSPERLRMLFPSTCVRLRYGRRALSLEVFPGSAATRLRPRSASRPPSAPCRADLPARRPRRGQRGLPSPLPLRSLRHPVVRSTARRSRNVHRAPIGYASRPGLRTRLTPGGSTLPGKP